MLKEKVAQIEEERAGLRDSARKRSREESSSLSPKIASDDLANKRVRMAFDGQSVQASLMPMSHASSPSSLASSPRSNDSSSHNSFSPFPLLPEPRETPVVPQGNGLGSLFDFMSTDKSNLFEPGEPLDTFNCGFCTDNMPCVCRELAMQQVSERMAAHNTVSMKVESMDMQTSVSQHSTPQFAPTVPSQQSILDNLPAFQPAVPLRRRTMNASLTPSHPSIFPISSAPSQPHIPTPRAATCSGDPSNCLACADDAFGKAFCAAISNSVSTAQCETCPGRSTAAAQMAGTSASRATASAGPSGAGCCGNPALCGQSGCGSSNASAGGEAAVAVSMSTYMSQTSAETIPCDDAWRQLKSHPNVAFTDLALLAEVVARRSKCTGPRVEISPAPGTITPERGISPFVHIASQTHQQQQQQRTGTNHDSVLLTDPHAQYHERQRVHTPPQLVPQEILIQCGRRRVREVQADGVRDALRLLDAKFSLP